MFLLDLSVQVWEILASILNAKSLSPVVIKYVTNLLIINNKFTGFENVFPQLIGSELLFWQWFENVNLFFLLQVCQVDVPSLRFRHWDNDILLETEGVVKDILSNVWVRIMNFRQIVGLYL